MSPFSSIVWFRQLKILLVTLSVFGFLPRLSVFEKLIFLIFVYCTVDEQIKQLVRFSFKFRFVTTTWRRIKKFDVLTKSCVQFVAKTSGSQEMSFVH